MVYGNNDNYLNPERLEVELKHAGAIFKNHLNIIPFNGTHEIDNHTILELSK